MQYVGSTMAPNKAVEDWPIIEHGGDFWFIAPVPIAPIARRDIPAVCGDWYCDIPTSDLALAIWEAADLKLDRNLLVRTPNDIKNGASIAAFKDQRRIISEMIGDRPFGILHGTHKDWVRMPDGRIDLYGWWDLAGVIKEKGRTSHNDVYVDYSQGARPVRKVPDDFMRDLRTTMRSRIRFAT